MYRFRFVLFCFITSLPFSRISAQVQTQSDHYPFSVFANLGYGYTNFDIPTQLNYYGELGLTYHISNHIFVYGSINTQNFYKPNSPGKAMKYFMTNMRGIDLGVLYELALDEAHSIGFGTALNVNAFKAQGIDENNKFSSTNGYYPKPIYNYKFILMARKDLSESFDLQFGITYNMLQSYYADLYEDLSKPSLDTYINVFGGLVYYVGAHNFGNFLRHPKKVGCPRF